MFRGFGRINKILDWTGYLLGLFIIECYASSCLFFLSIDWSRDILAVALHKRGNTMSTVIIWHNTPPWPSLRGLPGLLLRSRCSALDPPVEMRRSEDRGEERLETVATRAVSMVSCPRRSSQHNFHLGQSLSEDLGVWEKIHIKKTGNAQKVPQFGFCPGLSAVLTINFYLKSVFFGFIKGWRWAIKKSFFWVSYSRHGIQSNKYFATLFCLENRTRACQ